MAHRTASLFFRVRLKAIKLGFFEFGVGANLHIFRALQGAWATMTHPLTPPQGGEVLAARRARGQAQQGFACPKPSSVFGKMSAPMVRFAGRPVRH